MKSCIVVSDSDKESVHDDGNDDVSVISLFPQQNKDSFNDDINPGSDNGSVNEEVHSTTNLLSQPRTHSQAQRKSARIQGRTQGEVAPVGRTRYINVP